jgi:hypothetical protein
MTAGREASGRRARQPLGERRHARAARIIDLAWADLPAEHRLLLENVGAARWRVVDQALADCVDDLLRSAGHAPIAPADRLGLADAVGVWVEELRLVLVDASHPALADLDDQSCEMMLARIAWHEWGHALSVVRAESRRRRGETGRPPWLDDRIYQLVRRISTWND